MMEGNFGKVLNYWYKLKVKKKDWNITPQCDSVSLKGQTATKNLRLNCAGPDCLKAGLFKGLIVQGPNCLGPDCL